MVYMATVLPMCVGSTYVVLTFFMPKLTHFCKPAASFDQTKLERTMGLTKQMSGSEVSALSLDAKEELIMIQQASLRKMQEVSPTISHHPCKRASPWHIRANFMHISEGCTCLQNIVLTNSFVGMRHVLIDHRGPRCAHQ